MEILQSLPIKIGTNPDSTKKLITPERVFHMHAYNIAMYDIYICTE